MIIATMSYLTHETSVENAKKIIESGRMMTHNELHFMGTPVSWYTEQPPIGMTPDEIKKWSVSGVYFGVCDEPRNRVADVLFVTSTDLMKTRQDWHANSSDQYGFANFLNKSVSVKTWKDFEKCRKVFSQDESEVVFHSFIPLTDLVCILVSSEEMRKELANPLVPVIVSSFLRRAPSLPKPGHLFGKTWTGCSPIPDHAARFPWVGPDFDAYVTLRDEYMEDLL